MHLDHDFASDGQAYRLRHLVKRTLCPLMDFPPIATRYDKRARYFLAGVCIIVALALSAR
jgi:putative transposase